MVDFNGLLKKSLSGVAEAYNAAYSDLESFVEGIDAAIKENAGPLFGLTIGSSKDDIKGSTFRIFFDTNINNDRAETITIKYFFIPATGYPVRYGQYSHKNGTFTIEALVENKEQLESYFVSLLDNPESPLLQAVAYAVRAEPEAFDEEPPF